eukprot:6208399-Pleurochrysis_carterae.AAC.2
MLGAAACPASTTAADAASSARSSLLMNTSGATTVSSFTKALITASSLPSTRGKAGTVSGWLARTRACSVAKRSWTAANLALISERWREIESEMRGGSARGAAKKRLRSAVACAAVRSSSCCCRRDDSVSRDMSIGSSASCCAD